MSVQAAKAIPPLIGNPKFVGTTNDIDFVNQLKSRKWSVIFFAPGASRFSAASQPIPGGNIDTQGWTLEDYRRLVYEHQSVQVQIVETQYENETVNLLRQALELAPDSK